MMTRNLLIVGLLSLSMLGMSGCAHKMAKQGDAMPAASAEAVSGDSAQDQSAAPAAETTAALPNPLSEGSATSPATMADAPAAKDPATAKAKDAAAEKQAAVALLPLPSQEVMDTINKMTHHPRVRYLSRTAQYSYYVGGRLDAEYDINKNELVVTNDRKSSDDGVTCEYSKDGKMISDNKTISSEVVGECNNLINELTKYLSR